MKPCSLLNVVAQDRAPVSVPVCSSCSRPSRTFFGLNTVYLCFPPLNVDLTTFPISLPQAIPL